jgi:galactokinase
MTIREEVIQKFQEEYNNDPHWITRSPGRVNIIGEHTDYNDGFVLPMAINYAAWVALRPRSDNQIRIRALDMNEELVFNLDNFTKDTPGWQEYVKGVAWALQEEGFGLSGWEGVVAGDVPIGAGLSSSAALELALARAFALVSGLEWDPRRIALACQKAENHWVGINSGIMDQMVSACGKENNALLIDCRNLETRLVPLPEKARIVILDTATRRGLVDSEYNERRAQCEATACYFNVPALRDLSLEELEDRLGLLNQTLYNRARHVLSANQRVLNAVRALEQGDPAALGELMNASHASMRDDYEISREEMDQMVAIAQEQPGSYGARMTGGGFGGCAIALVAEDQVDLFRSEVGKQYYEKTGLEAQIYLTQAVDGTSFEELG